MVSGALGDALRIGGTRLYSPASGLLNVVDCLACFIGTGGEIDEGMRQRSSPSCVELRRVGLRVFLAQPISYDS